MVGASRVVPLGKQDGHLRLRAVHHASQHAHRNYSRYPMFYRTDLLRKLRLASWAQHHPGTSKATSFRRLSILDGIEQLERCPAPFALRVEAILFSRAL